MSAIRIGSAPARASTPRPGSRESRVSLYFLLWLIAAPFVGFVLSGDQVFDLGARGDWQAWKAAVVGGLLMIPSAVGAYFGLRAILKGFRAGWVGFVANLVLGLVAIGMPILEALTD
jgi:hypothetical protein